MSKKAETKQKLVNVSEILLTDNKEGYTTETKCMALAFMEASQRDYQGTLTPKYSEVSSLLDIPEPTLKHWWKKRDEIIGMSETALNELPRLTALRLAVETNKIIDEFNRRGYKKLSARDLIALFNQYVTKSRLLTGRSTQNVAVQHGYSPVVPVKYTNRKPANEISPADVISDTENTKQNT